MKSTDLSIVLSEYKWPWTSTVKNENIKVAIWIWPPILSEVNY